MTMGLDPIGELAPRFTQPLEGTTINRPRHLHGRPLAGLHPPGGNDRRGNGNTNLKIEDRWIHSKMMCEPWPRLGNTLRGNRPHQFTQPRPHDVLNFATWDRDVYNRTQSIFRPDDLGCIDHKAD